VPGNIPARAVSGKILANTTLHKTFYDFSLGVREVQGPFPMDSLQTATLPGRKNPILLAQIWVLHVRGPRFPGTCLANFNLLRRPKLGWTCANGHLGSLCQSQ